MDNKLGTFATNIYTAEWCKINTLHIAFKLSSTHTFTQAAPTIAS